MRSSGAIENDSVARPESVEVVRFEHAGIAIGGKPIWRDVSFEVRSGEFIAIMGPNGAGKSTLLKVILGLQTLTEGTLTVLGESARRGNPLIGYMPQRRVFDTDVRIRGRDLVRLGLDGTRWGIPLPGLRRLWGGDAQVREEQAHVEAALNLVNATAYADRPIGEMSGGEQQRLLIAQALVTRPRLLLLDEPLEGLDLPNQQTVATVIRRISEEENIAVMMVAHDINPILGYIDRTLYVAQCQTVIGTPQEVITSEMLSYLYGAPIEVLHTRDGRLLVVGLPEEVSHHAAIHQAR